MALNITNPVVVSKVERLARATGLSKTAAGERAFDQWLRETVGADNGSAGVMALLAQLDRIADRDGAVETLAPDPVLVELTQ